ncbi:neural cell adhesion molecule 1 isoform 2-T3 [Cochliomyia hominivorax]
MRNDPPYFEETNVQIFTFPNNDVVLNCDVRNFHVNNVIVWYKDDIVYSNGQYTLNSRIKNLKNNSIILKNVQPDDAGNYYCQVLPDNIRLHVKVEVNKLLSILCDGRDVLDRTIVFRQGESHICECKTRGPNEANIKWSLNGNRFDENFGELMHGSIILNGIEDYHSGIYQCLDDDGSENPRHGMFNIVVLFPPKVTTHRHYVNTEIGGNANLYCDYKGNPIAIASWFKNNKPIKYSEKHMITYETEKHFNRSTLIVNDITIEDLGEYICRAENSLGSNELRTHLMLEPEKGQLENVIIDGRKVTLHWLVRSLQPLSEAVLDYKMSGSVTWSSTTVIHTKRHENGIWKVTHEMELVEGEWQTRMKTKNTIGWSKFSAPFIFKIEDEDDTYNETTNEKMAMAGFGITKSSSSTVFLNSYIHIILLLTLGVKVFML